MTMDVATWSVLLYTRIDAPSLMESEVRRGLLERLRDEPVLMLSEAARALDLHYSTVMYHARMLARAGQVVLVTDGRPRLYLPGADRRRGALPVRALRALEALRDGAGTPAALARALDIPRGSAGSLLLGLERVGLAAREGARWRVTDLAGAHLSPGSLGDVGPLT